MDERTVVNWLLAAVTSVATAGTAYGRMHQRVKELEKASDENKKKTDAMDSKINDIRDDVAYIRGKLSKGIVVHNEKGE